MCSFPEWNSVLMKEGRDAYFFILRPKYLRYGTLTDMTVRVLYSSSMRDIG